MESFIQTYGPWGFLLYILYKELVPFVLNRVYPDRVKAEQAKRNTDALILRSEIEEKEHRRKMEERTADALEGIKDAVIITNERLDKLSDLMSEHSTFTASAISDMRVTVAKSKRGDSNPKIAPKRKP